MISVRKKEEQKTAASCDLAAIAAADARNVHGGDRIVLERVVGVLQRQRRAAREVHAGVVEVAGPQTSPSAPLPDALREERPHPPLLVQACTRMMRR